MTDPPRDPDERDLTTINWLPEVREQLNADIVYAQELMRQIYVLETMSGSDEVSRAECLADLRADLHEHAQKLRDLWDLRDQPELLADGEERYRSG